MTMAERSIPMGGQVHSSEKHIHFSWLKRKHLENTFPAHLSSRLAGLTPRRKDSTPGSVGPGLCQSSLQPGLEHFGK